MSIFDPHPQLPFGSLLEETPVYVNDSSSDEPQLVTPHYDKSLDLGISEQYDIDLLKSNNIPLERVNITSSNKMDDVDTAEEFANKFNEQFNK